MTDHQSSISPGVSIQRENPDDWNPLDESLLRNQRDSFDTMRERCPVAHSKFLGWSLFSHEDIAGVLADPETYINVSKFPAIPNGLNPPEHGSWYQKLAGIFDNESMVRLEPQIRQLAGRMIEPKDFSGQENYVEKNITPFVFESLCSLLGWPLLQWRVLAAWVQKNQVLALHPDASSGKKLADSFSSLVHANLALHRATNNFADTSATEKLLNFQVDGKPISEETITTILRNWVAGHGTTAEALGIVLKHVAEDKELQEQLRSNPELVPSAIEEIMRMDGPLVANSRTTTREVKLQGFTIPRDANMSLMWIAANRDPAAFKDACDFKLERDTSASLVWGKGIHMCLGAPLARLEIRVALEALLAGTRCFELAGMASPRKVYPGNGYRALHLRFV